MATGTRILVVEDESAIRELIRDSLSLIEIETDGVGDGLEALNRLRRQRYDLVILDVNIPKIDGLALLSKIRDEGSNIPVLVLSARSQRDDITQGLKVGADDYLVKPLGSKN